MSTFVVPTSLPIPLQEPISEAKPDKPLRGFITFSWVQWLTSISQSISLTATTAGSRNLTTQSASIAATDIAAGPLSAGLYRVEWYFRVTRAAGVSSSFQIVWDWTEGGTPQSYTAPAVTGNTTNTIQQDIQLFIKADGNSPIRYTVTYASVGAPTMQYSLSAVLTAVGA